MPTHNEDIVRLELEVDLLKAKLAERASSPEASTKVPVAWISLLSAGIGSVATIVVALVAGSFSLQEQAAEKDTALELEQAKFSYQLIQLALSEADVGARAKRLRFLLDIGLLENLEEAKLKIYAAPDDPGQEDGSKPPPRLTYSQQDRNPTGLDPGCQEFGMGTHFLLVDPGLDPTSVKRVLMEELEITDADAQNVLAEMPRSLRCYDGISEQDPLFLKLKAAGARVENWRSSNPW